MSESTKALATLPKPTVLDVVDDCWEISGRSDLSPSGYKITRVPIPQDLDKLTPLQQAIILQSTKAWSDSPIPFLLYMLQRCRALNLDPASGDIYTVDGRLSTSDDAKIRNARRSGKVEWVRRGEPIKATNPISGKPDTYIEVTMKHRDETEPQSYKAWLSEWFNPKNANWSARPIDALSRKAEARLSHRMFPLGEDEPLDAPAIPIPWEEAFGKGLVVTNISQTNTTGGISQS